VTRVGNNSLYCFDTPGMLAKTKKKQFLEILATISFRCHTVLNISKKDIVHLKLKEVRVQEDIP
jgi:hypothetical protein